MAFALADVRFAPNSDRESGIPANGHVRFTPKSGHVQCTSPCPLCAMCGRLRFGKNFLHDAALVGAAMCSAC